MNIFGSLDRSQNEIVNNLRAYWIPLQERGPDLPNNRTSLIASGARQPKIMQPPAQQQIESALQHCSDHVQSQRGGINLDREAYDVDLLFLIFFHGRGGGLLPCLPDREKHDETRRRRQDREQKSDIRVLHSNWKCLRNRRLSLHCYLSYRVFQGSWDNWPPSYLSTRWTNPEILWEGNST